MDLLTLVTASALTVDPDGLPWGPDPRVMQALIWEQSGGEPWSFSAPGQSRARVFPTIQDAIREAQASVGGRIRVGLTGLPADGPAATAAMFAPRPNIALATSQIAQLVERCKTLSRFKPDPIYCAIAAFHGSWEQPDLAFADTVKATVVKGDAPNFELPNDSSFGSNDVAGDALTADPKAVAPPCGAPPYGRRLKFQQRPRHQSTVRLFRVRLNGGLDDSFGDVSQDVARFRMFGC